METSGIDLQGGSNFGAPLYAASGASSPVSALGLRSELEEKWIDRDRHVCAG
jgi:hypothetical protein